MSLRASLRVIALLPLILPVAAQTPTPGDPAGVIQALYKLDATGDWSPIFDVQPTALMVQYFTPAFIAAWKTGMTHIHEYPVVEGDPLTGGQDTGAPKILELSVASNIVTVTATFGNHPQARKTLQYVLSNANGAWQVDDIVYPPPFPMKSLRGALAR